jgi:hypothetical protein
MANDANFFLLGRPFLPNVLREGKAINCTFILIVLGLDYNN